MRKLNATKRNGKLFLVLAMSVALNACISLLPEPSAAPTVYRLTVPQSQSTKSTSAMKVVNIEYPTAPRALNGSNIVLSPDGRRLTSAASSNWAEAVPSMLRNSLIDTLARDGQVIGVIPKGSTRVPYRLNMDIRRFEAVFDQGEDAAPNAIVQVNIVLTDANTRKVVGVHAVNKQARAGMKSVSSIVQAQDTATREAMDEISNWLATQVDTNAS